MESTLFFRADGNNAIGLGHVIRSLALAQMLERMALTLKFIIRRPSMELINEIKKVCSMVIEIPDNISFENEAKFINDNLIATSDILILDGYKFDTNYQKVFKDSEIKVVCIDDIHSCHFLADLVINHSPGAVRQDYSCAPYTRLLLGPKYSLLRKPFIKKIRHRDYQCDGISSVFVGFGGADSSNLTSKILSALVEIEGIENVNLVIGSAYKYVGVLKEQISVIGSKKKVNLYMNLSAEEMTELILRCDLGIVPASSQLYELLSLKIPVISGYFVDNQKGIFEGFRRLNAIVPLGDFNASSAEEIRKVIRGLLNNEKLQLTLISNQNNIFDDQIENRIVHAFEDLLK